MTAIASGGAVDQRALDSPAAAPTVAPTNEESTIGAVGPTSRGNRSERQRRGRLIGVSVVLVCVVAAGATLLVGALRGEDREGQGGSMIGETDEWVAEVVDDGDAHPHRGRHCAGGKRTGLGRRITAPGLCADGR